MSKVKYLSLVNLIAEEKIVTEFLQKEMSSKNLSKGVLSIINNSEKQDVQKRSYLKLIDKLNVKGSPYLSAAKHIYD
jgi:lipid-A-disaccharide synthase